MRIFSLLSIVAIMIAASPQTQANEDTPYKQIIDMYDQATVMAGFPDAVGSYVGRCYEFINPKTAAGALLSVQERIISDNGPLFPITSEKKAIPLYHPEANYYDEYPTLNPNLREEVNQNWPAYSELNFLTNEWMYSSTPMNRIISLRSFNGNILAVELVEDTSKLDKDLLNEFKRISYKRVYTACYYFKKIGN